MNNQRTPTSEIDPALQGLASRACYSKKLTVVIPHRQRDKNLRRCLFSVATQTRLPHEVVVVDYDTPDSHNRRRHSLEELALNHELKLQIIYGGPAEAFQLTTARNKGCRAASSQYIASLDADCSIPPTSLIDAEMWLDRVNVGLVGAPVLYCMEEGFSFKPPWYGTYPSGGFQVFRTREFERIGGFNELMHAWGYEDRDFMTRLLALDESRQIMMLSYPYFHNWHPQELIDAKLLEGENLNREIAQKSFWNGIEWKFLSEAPAA